MSVIHIFLGGTGKYIAETLQANAVTYGQTPTSFFAFDVDPRATQGGTAALGTQLQSVEFGTFPDHALNAIASQQWIHWDAGRSLTPGPFSAGPARRPEVSILHRIAVDARDMNNPQYGLWGLRASGLLAVDAFFDPAAPGGLGPTFAASVHAAIVAASAGQGPVRINLISSSAGGTGAGTFLPIALWLKTLVPGATLQLTLTLFSYGTFEHEILPQTQLTELLTKGQSGTFAIMRELKMLGQYAADSTTLPTRSIPRQGQQSFDYTLDGDLFTSVFWIGRRPTDIRSKKEDVYEEGAKFIGPLGDPVFWRTIAGQVGGFPSGLVVSAASIDYDKPRVARRLSGSIVVEALRALQGDPVQAAPMRVRLNNLPVPPVVAANPSARFSGAIVGFIQAEWNNGLSSRNNGSGLAAPANLDSMMTPLTPALDADGGRGLAGVLRIGARANGAYASASGPWLQYCQELFTDLAAVDAQHPAQAKARVTQATQEVAETFGQWLVQGVVGPALNPPGQAATPTPIIDVEATMDQFGNDLDRVRSFFETPNGVSDRVAAESGLRFQTQNVIRADIDVSLKRMTDLANPPTSHGRLPLSWLQRVLVGLAFAGTAVLSWVIVSLFTGTLISVVVASVAALGASWLLVRQLRSRRPDIGELRRRAENELFASYEALAYQQAAGALFDHLVPAAVSGLPATREAGAATWVLVPSCANRLKMVKASLGGLSLVLGELQARAERDLARTLVPPPSSVYQAGLNITVPAAQAGQLTAKLMGQVRAVVNATGRDSTIEIHDGNGSVVSAQSVELMAKAISSHELDVGLIGADPGEQAIEGTDRALDTVASASLPAGLLPTNLVDAMATGPGGVALPSQTVTDAWADALSSLVNRDRQGNPKQGLNPGSAPLNVVAPAPVFSCLVVPNTLAAAEIAKAITSAAPPLPQVSAADLTSLPQVPTLFAGESVVAVRFFNPAATLQTPDMLATPEGQVAAGTYYGVGALAQMPGAVTSVQRNFHILPELAAAAAIELKGAPRQPLHPIVVARLLGSDIDNNGPTLIELFYLARARGVLTTQPDGAANAGRWITAVTLPGMNSIEILHTPTPLPIPSVADPFFGGRPIIDQFDAFCDLMLYDGVAMMAQVGARRFATFANRAEEPVASWAFAHQSGLLRSVQEGVCNLWYDVNALDSDLTLMMQHCVNDASEISRAGQQLQATVAADWRRVVQTLIQTGQMKRAGIGNFPGQLADANH